MRIGIIAAMQVEVEDILAEVELISEADHFGRTVYFGQKAGHQLYLGVCGVGKVNAASFAQLLIDRYQVELLINTGIAGSLEPGLGMLTMVTATGLRYHDFPEDILARTYPYTREFPTDEAWRMKAALAVPEGTKHKSGVIASGDDFIDSEEKKLRIVEATSAIACDMESAAVAQVAKGADLPCLILRCISDDADQSYKAEEYQLFEPRAAALSARVVLNLLGANPA